MKRTSIIGLAFGDEGKGAIVHRLSPDYDWVIRYSGGSNAGHTIYRDGKKFVHNLLPSVDFRKKTVKSYLGSGMVIDLVKLHEEVLNAETAFRGVARSIYVDKDAFLVLDQHKEEDKKSNSHIGSTNRGIGPAYKAKIGREGYRINDLFSRKLNDVVLLKSLFDLCELGVNFVHSMDLKRDLEKSHLLFEGAQGVLLDINHGTYPFVSCGDSTIAGIAASGFAHMMPEKVYGISKVYSTRVGAGPFPTELFGEEAENLRKLGNEYGATTGRPRRVGWLDLPAMNYAIHKSGVNSLVLTKFDILNGLDPIKICDRYKINPTSPSHFQDAKPYYTEFPGWHDANNNSEIKSFIEFVEQKTGVVVEYISRGTSDTDFVNTLGLK